MNGILILDKPKGLSSHDCVNIARRAFNTRKVGHSGTLDPEASGVLVLAVNQATRILEFLNQDDKRYEFEVCFNQTTNTLDHTGEVTDERRNHQIDTADLDEALEQFIGPYEQTPPDYAAVKVDGKKLYEYAREGKPIPDVPKRAITVHDIRRLTTPIKKDGLAYAKFSVHASKGFYVRKLAEDLACKLNTVAHTTMIHRTKAGKFDIDKSVSLQDLKDGQVTLLTMNEALEHIPAYRVSGETFQDVSHGKKLTIQSESPLLRMVDDDGRLVAIYIKKDASLYKPKKVFISGGQS